MQSIPQPQLRNPMPDPRWNAVENRDPLADGQFVYAVLTTGIYCRPSCPARRPRPENVSFHAGAAEAERAGYRPCRRCHPERTDGPPAEGDRVAALCRYIDSAGHVPTLDELARFSGWSPSHLQRRFKALTGLSPRAYAAARRTDRLQRELGSGASVTQAIHRAGWNSGGRFYASADEALGMKPGDYRKGGAGTRIRFALGRTSLGEILVACSEAGVCAILLGDEPNALLRELERTFPKADLVGGDAGFEQLVARVVGLVEAPALDADLPLDIRGTAFQRRVWDALRRIPPGQTLSYTELARRIGAPRAVRAVASACAANHLAVAIPCHRVVRGDGGLAGYRWGVDRKRALLAREEREK